jgi:hypothetical protein
MAYRAGPAKRLGWLRVVLSLAVAAIFVLSAFSAGVMGGTTCSNSTCVLYASFANSYWTTSTPVATGTGSNTYNAIIQSTTGAGTSQQLSEITSGSGVASSANVYLKEGWDTTNFVAWKAGTPAYTIQMEWVYSGEASENTNVCSGFTESATIELLLGFRPYDVTTATWLGTGDYVLTAFGQTLICSSSTSMTYTQVWDAQTTTTSSSMFSIPNGNTVYIFAWAGPYTSVTTTYNAMLLSACMGFSNVVAGACGPANHLSNSGGGFSLSYVQVS